MPGFDKLNLTDDQKEQIKQIMKDSHEKIMAVLTDAQKTQLQAMMAAHKAKEAGADAPATPPASN